MCERPFVRSSIISFGPQKRIEKENAKYPNERKRNDFRLLLDDQSVGCTGTKGSQLGRMTWANILKRKSDFADCAFARSFFGKILCGRLRKKRENNEL